MEDQGLRSNASWIWAHRQRPIIAYVFLLFIAVVLVLSYFVKLPDLVAEVAENFQDYKAGKLTLDLRTQDVKSVERHLDGIPFQARVFDLGMIHYQLVGTRAHRLLNRKSAFFVYHGEGNKILICQMYPGSTTELAQGAGLREHNGIQFHIYRQNGLTLVFWQEGKITCALVSDIDPEEVTPLSFSAAVKI